MHQPLGHAHGCTVVYRLVAEQEIPRAIRQERRAARRALVVLAGWLDPSERPAGPPRHIAIAGSRD